MRQFCETVSMSLMCSHPKINTFTEFEKNPKFYPLYKSIDFIGRKKNVKLLGLSDQVGIVLKEIYNFHNQYSHASALSIYYHFISSKEQEISFGGDFHPDKIQFYNTEIEDRIDAAIFLYSLMDNIERILKENNVIS